MKEDLRNSEEYRAWINRTPEQIQEFNDNVIENIKLYLGMIVEYNIVLNQKDSDDILYLLTDTTEKIIKDMSDMKRQYDYQWAGFFLDCHKTFIQNVLNINLDKIIDKQQLNDYTPETISEKDIRFVYIAFSNGVYKIGSTKDLVKRLKQFTTGNHSIDIIASLKTSVENANSIEKTLHNVYKENNIKNEWFKFTKIELEYIIKTLNFNYHF